MERKIISKSSLDDIVVRLRGYDNIVVALGEAAGMSTTPEESFRCLSDLLECIIGSLEADIAAAEDYPDNGQLSTAAGKENL